MNAIFYNNTSDPRVLSKTLTQVSTASITLKDTTNMIHPKIIMSASYAPNKANYCYIPNLKRYYFIRYMQFIPGKLAELILDVDPFMSFATEIKAIPVIADRSTSNGYKELVDGAIKTEGRKRVFHLNMGNNGVFTNTAEYRYILVTGG